MAKGKGNNKGNGKGNNKSNNKGNNNENKHRHDTSSGEKTFSPAPPSPSTSEADKMSPQTPLPKKVSDKKPPWIPFKTKIWLIFGVCISLFAIVAAAIFDCSLGAGFEKIRDSRFPDFVLATLAISASVINIIIDLNAAEIDINKKINYAIFPSITVALSLAYYSFLYGISEQITALKWDWVLPVAVIVLLINIGIGIILSKK